MKNSKITLPAEYQLFLKKNYPEHFKKILSSKSSASFLRVFYPVSFFAFPLLMFVSFALYLIFFKEMIAQFLDQTRLAEFTSPASIQATGFILIFIGVLVSLCCFFLGVYLGFTKASELLFENEKIEIQARQVWMMDAANQDKKLSFSSQAMNEKHNTYSDLNSFESQNMHVSTHHSEKNHSVKDI